MLKVWPQTSLKARLKVSTVSGMSQSVVPSTPSAAGDAMLQTDEEVSADQCCTCHKPVDLHNSLVIVRANAKSPEVRRCRSCHNVKGAIQRLAKNSGNLVGDFTKVTGDKVTEFYKQHAHLRGEDLKAKLEDIVTDWKTSTTRFEFTQDADYLDEIDLKTKYEKKPEVLDNILKNGRRFFCPIKKVTLYADPKYSAKVQDAVEHGSTEKRKGQVALLEENPEPKKKPKNPKNTKDGQPKPDDDTQQKLKAGEKKKLAKKLDGSAAKVALLKDNIEEAKKFGDMIPTYVLEASHKCLEEAKATSQVAQNVLDAGQGDSKTQVDNLDNIIEKVGEAMVRIKTQMESAANFTK